MLIQESWLNPVRAADAARVRAHVSPFGGATLMRKAGIILGIIAGGLALLIAIYVFGYTYRYHYRMTVEVEVDGQIKSGSGVIAVISGLDPVPGRALRYQSSVDGECVYVDLGARGNLFALLTGKNSAAYDIAEKAFNPTPYAASRKEQEERLKRMSTLRARAELPFDQLPKLLTFKDLNNPNSVEFVRPDDLAATLGPGIRLKRIIIEMTGDPVTRGIETKLPWLKNILPGEYIDGKNWTQSRSKLQTVEFNWRL